MIANADAARIPLPDKSVHAVITSPPYFGPRKYKGEQARDWPAVSYSPMPGLPPVEVPAMRCELGREARPEHYIAHLVLCFREVYRTLRDDGVAWCVIGDSYASQGGPEPSQTKWQVKGTSDTQADRVGRQIGLKQGDMMGIPYRLLFALQAAGWVVRQDCVWAKVSPLPESVAGTRWERHRVKVKALWSAENPHPSKAGGTNYDRGNNGQAEWLPCPGCARCAPTGGYVLRRGSWRHTRSHETVLMLTKGMQYFSDQERVRERSTGQTGSAANFQRESKEANIPGQAHRQHRDERDATEDNGYRNPRDVLTPSPSPFKGEHYAAFPPDLIRPLILSSAPLKCCPACGAGWAAVVELTRSWRDTAETKEQAYPMGSGNRTIRPSNGGMSQSDNNVIGYRPTCACNASDWQPGLVLDPFAGSGTTGVVCRELGLRFVGLDISGEYLRDIALVRSERLTPDSAMVNLPLFELLQS